MESIKYRALERIPGVILQRRDLTVTAKRVYSLISYCQGHNQSVCLAVPWIAGRLDMSRQAISRAVGQLVDRQLLTRRKKPRQSPIFSIKRLSLKKFFLDVNVGNSEYSSSIYLMIAYLKFRQGKNNRAWQHIKTMCRDLGMSKSNVLRCLAKMEADKLVLIDHAHGGLKQGNKYALTAKGINVTKCSARPESGVSKCNPISNTIPELKELNKPDFSNNQDLSEKRRALVHNRVALPVAAALAEEHSLANIQNAIVNTAAQSRLAYKKRKFFNFAGYLVAVLNGSRRTGEPITINSYAQSQKTLFDDLNSKQPAKLNAHNRQIAVDELAARQKALQDGTAKSNISDGVKRMLGVA